MKGFEHNASKAKIKLNWWPVKYFYWLGELGGGAEGGFGGSSIFPNPMLCNFGSIIRVSSPSPNADCKFYEWNPWQTSLKQSTQQKGKKEGTKREREKLPSPTSSSQKKAKLKVGHKRAKEQIMSRTKPLYN